ncbi:phage tail tape measure protein [Listeria booriae]|uniref:phage tail tape measure protein n=1 Tax=Listeria booriae TaxID=1552123 RepID=UPI0016286C02|nr:phage tail tape measure protein [Listeria booriae]MBC2367836.1 phage tail tape measure protein [Listeria booriae]
MSDYESNVVLNFKSNGQVQYADTIKDINKVMNTASAEYKRNVSAMGNNASASSKLANQQQKLKIQVEGAEKRTKMLREEYEKSAKETGENSEQTQKLYNQLLKAETAENNLKNSLNKVNDELKEQGNEAFITAEKIEKIEKAGEKVKAVGKGMTAAVTVPILAIGTASIAAFKEVDEAMDTITMKTGATGKVLEELQGSFDNVASVVPDDLQTVAEALGEVNTQFEFMGKTLETETDRVLQFATITGQDVTSSAIDAKKAIEAYKLQNNDLGIVLDAVAKTSQDSGVATQDLFQKVIAGAPQIKALGLSFAEGTALMGQFEKGGVDSSAALSSLSKATVIYAKDGKSLEKGLAETIKKIQGAKSQTDKLNIASEVFGSKGATRMVDAINRNVLSMDDLKNASKDAMGTVYQTFDDTLDPIDNVDIALNNGKLLFGSMGEAIQVAFLPALKKIIEALMSFKNAFSKLSPETKQMIVVISTIAVAIGPVILAIGGLMTGFGKMVAVIQRVRAIMLTLNAVMMANPIGLIILAIAGLIATFTLLWMKCEGFRNFFYMMWEGIKIGFNATVSFFKTLIDQLAQWFRLGLVAVQAIWGTLSGWWNSFVTQPFRAAIDYIKGLFNSFKSGTTNVLNGFKSIWGSLKGWFMGSVVSPFQTGFSRVVSFFVNFKENASNILSSIRDMFGRVGSWLYDLFVQPFVDAVGSISDAMGNIGASISGMFESAKAGIINAINWIIEKANGFIVGINNMSSSLEIVGIDAPRISQIPYLAKGGHLVNGQAIVGEAGPELLSVKRDKTTVTPLSPQEKSKGISGNMKNNGDVHIHLQIGEVHANSMNDIDRINKMMALGAKKAKIVLGGS